MKWALYDFKSAKEPWFDAAEEAYYKKISHFVKFEIIHLKTKNVDRDQADLKVKFEETVLLEKLSSDDYIIVFDEKGNQYDSTEFAKLVTKAEESAKKRCVLIIGGAFGLGEKLKQKAHVSISLSKMVMNHLVAETVVLEQFYRAQTIINRIPYHNI